MMKSESLRNKISKKVFIVMKSGWHYEGILNAVSDETAFIKDRFNEDVELDIVDISTVTVKHT